MPVADIASGPIDPNRLRLLRPERDRSREDAAASVVEAPGFRHGELGGLGLVGRVREADRRPAFLAERRDDLVRDDAKRRDSRLADRRLRRAPRFCDLLLLDGKAEAPDGRRNPALRAGDERRADAERPGAFRHGHVFPRLEWNPVSAAVGTVERHVAAALVKGGVETPFRDPPHIDRARHGTASLLAHDLAVLRGGVFRLCRGPGPLPDEDDPVEDATAAPRPVRGELVAVASRRQGVGPVLVPVPHARLQPFARHHVVVRKRCVFVDLRGVRRIDHHAHLAAVHPLAVVVVRGQGEERAHPHLVVAGFGDLQIPGELLHVGDAEARDGPLGREDAPLRVGRLEEAEFPGFDDERVARRLTDLRRQAHRRAGQAYRVGRLEEEPGASHFAQRGRSGGKDAEKGRRQPRRRMVCRAHCSSLLIVSR